MEVSQARSDALEARRRNQQPHNQMVAPAQPTTQRGTAEDSWIDVASQQSTHSLHSESSHEIVTAGLDLKRSVNHHSRRSRSQATSQSSERSNSVAGSSQDEYEESESESDPVMSSSNEDEEEDDDDDASTALGALPANQHVFTPQPNAFSHPPTSNNVQSAPSPDSYFPSISHVTYSDRLPSNRMISQRTFSQRPYTRERTISSRSHPDHDAALRASLTTLLSCAAAVRPKGPEPSPSAPHPRPAQPRTFRLVPGSELDTNNTTNTTTATTRNIAASSPHDAKPLRRRRSRESSKERQTKKIKAIRAATAGDEFVSPTVMAWMISAGVVLVVSAISFSAGYAWGKDAGRFEGDLSCSYCGTEAVKAGGSGSGLRKLRWTPAAQSIRA